MAELLVMTVLLALAAAMFAIESRGLLASVIAVGAVGFLMAIAFLLLAAPDIAIVQIGVEALTLAILVKATIGRDARPAPKRSLAGRIAAATAIVAVAVFGTQVLAGFPPFGVAAMDRFADAPAATYLESSLTETGIPNAVTAVLLDFRAYDTLGEATVLFCAVIGALALLRRVARTKKHAGDRGEEPS